MPKLCSERLLQIMEMSKFCSPTTYPDVPPLLTPRLHNYCFMSELLILDLTWLNLDHGACWLRTPRYCLVSIVTDWLPKQSKYTIHCHCPLFSHDVGSESSQTMDQTYWLFLFCLTAPVASSLSGETTGQCGPGSWSLVKHNIMSRYNHGHECDVLYRLSPKLYYYWCLWVWWNGAEC